MKSKFGVSTNCLMNLSLGEALEILSPITNLVEIQCDVRHSLFSHLDEAKSFDLRYTIHAPTADGNIACTFEPIRKASIEVLKETAKVAGEINAEKIVVHPGFCMEKKLWNESADAMVKSLEDIGKLQKEFSVRFVIENFGSWDFCHFRYPDLLPLIFKNGLGFCLDVGHANLNGVLDEFLRCGADHFHLHDNHGVQDEHAACGAGEIDFSKIVGLSGTKVIEVLNLEDVTASLDFLNKLEST